MRTGCAILGLVEGIGGIVGAGITEIFGKLTATS